MELTNIVVRLDLLCGRFDRLFILVVPFKVNVIILLLILTPGPGGPRHFVLLLEAPAGVCKPGGDLGQGHLSDDGQHDLLSFGGVGVLSVLVEPCFEGGGRVPGGVLPVRGVPVWEGSQDPAERVIVQGTADGRGVISRPLRVKQHRFI